MLEGEKEARAALLNALARRGRYSVQAAGNVRMLAGVILEQGRYKEAETLARAAIEIYEKVGAGDDSLALAFSRSQLGNTLVGQGRWAEAVAVYDAARIALASSEAYAAYVGNNLGYGVALLRTGRPDQAIKIFSAALERNQRLLGDKDRSTATARALKAMAEAARGEQAVALREFSDAVPVLLARSVDADDETSSRPARDQRLGMILAAYIGLLADVRGTSLERDAGIDAAAEAFRLADVARGQSVQRALDAGAARAAAKTPALADLVRREQDAKKQVSALLGVLAEALSQPTDRQDARTIAALREQIDALKRARVSLLEQIDKEFPAYAQLINPPPATVEQARRALRPGESLIATFVTAERTFVWAPEELGGQRASRRRFHRPVAHEQRAGARVEERAAETGDRFRARAAAARCVARRQHDPIGVESEAEDFLHREEAVAVHARDVGGRERERRLGEAVELTGNEAVRGERQDPIAGEVRGLHVLLVGIAADEDVAREIGPHRERDALDLVGGLGQTWQHRELRRIGTLHLRRAAERDRHASGGQRYRRRLATRRPVSLRLAEPRVPKADERSSRGIPGGQGAQRGERRHGWQHGDCVCPREPGHLPVVGEQQPFVRAERHGLRR